MVPQKFFLIEKEEGAMGGEKGEPPRFRTFRLEEDEIKKRRFRVSCLNPGREGGIELESRTNRLCGQGTEMTIDEMNENLLWKGRPYIRIPYCKYCNRLDTVGVFDDTPQLLGWVVHEPRGENHIFRLEKLTEEGFRRFEEELSRLENSSGVKTR
jgi:hypothetical protein